VHKCTVGGGVLVHGAECPARAGATLAAISAGRRPLLALDVGDLGRATGLPGLLASSRRQLDLVLHLEGGPLSRSRLPGLAVLATRRPW
jgi:hypothetical protein